MEIVMEQQLEQQLDMALPASLNLAETAFLFDVDGTLLDTAPDIAAAVSFHGLFDPPGLDPQPIKAKVVAFHGWDDPMVPPEAVVALGMELTEGGADWQIHAYGNVAHGFTNPNAQAIGIEGVRYNRLAAERSWTSFINLLEELFGEDA